MLGQEVALEGFGLANGMAIVAICRQGKRNARVKAMRETHDKIETETRLYITSSILSAELLASVVRGHWAIENGLHWVMDMVFRDDECRVRTGHAPANFTTIKHMACNLLRKAPSKDSMRLRRKVAAWDDDFLASVLTG